MTLNQAVLLILDQLMYTTMQSQQLASHPALLYYRFAQPPSVEDPQGKKLLYRNPLQTC